MSWLWRGPAWCLYALWYVIRPSAQLKTLLGTIAARILFIAALLFAIYNPWLSIAGIFGARLSDPAFLQEHWFVSSVFGLLSGGALGYAIITTHRACGFWGILVIGALSMLMAYGALYLVVWAGWLEMTTHNYEWSAYYVAAPLMLGIGISAGYIQRYWTGALNTSVVSEPVHHHS